MKGEAAPPLWLALPTGESGSEGQTLNRVRDRVFSFLSFKNLVESLTLRVTNI